MTSPTPTSPASSRRWIYAGIFGVLILVLVAVLANAFGSDPHEVPFMLKGKAAPAFTLRSLDTGEKVSLEQLRGKPVVINFWATWCGPCVYEHPVLQLGHQRYGKDVQFVGVVFEDTEENAKKFLTEHGSRFPQLFDDKATMPVDYGVSGVPETYFIDRSGVIRGKVAAMIDPDTLSRNIRELLAEAPTAAAQGAK